MRKPKKLRGGDFFCGAGGFTTGFMLAAAERNFTVEDFLAVNCKPVAIETHSANYPRVRHYCRRLEGVPPEIAVPGGRMDVLLASPECTHHSNARGAKPMNDQSRAGAFLVLQWAAQIYIKRILIENVREFRDWGPLGVNKRPIKARKGECYRAFIAGLVALGYRVEERILDAADYGAATSRTRLFIQAVRGNGKIFWPEQTHDEFARDGLKPWRDWREVIDLNIRGKSIYGRKKPLSENTMARIYDGLAQQGLNPYLIEITHTGKRRPRGAGEPFPTITTAKRGEIALCRPFLIPKHSRGKAMTGGLLPTVTTQGAPAVCQAFLLPQQSGGVLRASGRPFPTISGAGAIAMLKPFLVEYYGNSKKAMLAGKPLSVVTTKPRFGLAQPVLRYRGRQYLLDIEYRMVTPRELAAAMGFPAKYVIKGNGEEQTLQIGNAVEVNMARALGRAVLRGLEEAA